MTPLQVRLLLAVILVAGATLRLVGLGHGLRHEPVPDEAYFVDAAREVIATGNPDHRFHEYPALPVYVLLPVVAFTGDRAATYLGARLVIALAGIVSIALVFRLGRRVAGDIGGLYAAAALAFSTIDVRVAHEYRPDVLLGTTALVALLVFTAEPSGTRRDALRAGAAVGLATATKFSGAILGPAWALALPWPRRDALVSAVLGLAASLAAFAVLSPYSVLDPAALQEGAGTQAAYHFDRASPLATLLPIGLSYLKAWWRSFGPGGLLLAVAGAALLLRGEHARRRAPLVTLPVVALVVFSTSAVRHERFLIVASGAMAVLAAVAVARLAQDSLRAAAMVAVAGLAPPLATSADIVAALHQPRVEDDVVDRVHATLPAGSRVLTSVPTLGLDTTRLEVRRVMPQHLTPRAALEWDYVVLFANAEPEWAKQLDEVLRVDPRTPYSGVPVVVRRAPEALRPKTVRLDLSGARLAVSAVPEGAPHLTDGRADTAWSPGPEQSGGEWLEVTLPEPAWLGRVVLEQPPGATGLPRNLRVSVAERGGELRPVRVDLGRLPSREQPEIGPRADVFLLDAAEATTVRIQQVGRGPRPWQVAEVRLEALVDLPGWAAIQGRRIRRPDSISGASGRSGGKRRGGRP